MDENYDDHFFHWNKFFKYRQKEKTWTFFNEIFIFQDDKDLVHEFVNNQGLQCLVKIGGAADQNYQNYILRGRENISHGYWIKSLLFISSTWSTDALCWWNECSDESKWSCSMALFVNWIKCRKPKSFFLLFGNFLFSFDLLLKQV